MYFNLVFLKITIFFLFLDNDEWYSYVNFYSPRVAEKVVSAFRYCPFMIEGKACVLAKKPRNLVKKGRILMLHQCHELINHYLGFNKWNSEIVYHQFEWGSSDEQVYATAVKLSFKDFEDMTVEGVGLTEAKFSSLEEKPSKLAQAQKNSKNAALLNAFSKVLLVLVYTGDLNTKPKVAVRIDSSKKDPFHYDAIWSGTPLVQVQDVEMDPEEDVLNP